jgi:hypothetical protein
MPDTPNYEEIADNVEIGAPADVPLPPEAQREFLPLDHPKYQGIATAKGYKQDSVHNRLQRVHYSHEAMIEEMIINPSITQRELAKLFGRSENWLSIVIGSDAFQAALAKRRDDILDPAIVASIEERFKGVVSQSLTIVAEKLELTKNVDLALKTLDVGVKALGFGARQGGNQQNNQFIIQLPSKSTNSEEWRKEHDPSQMKQLPLTGTDNG